MFGKIRKTSSGIDNIPVVANVIFTASCKAHASLEEEWSARERGQLDNLLTHC